MCELCQRLANIGITNPDQLAADLRGIFTADFLDTVDDQTLLAIDLMQQADTPVDLQVLLGISAIAIPILSTRGVLH